MFGLNNFLPTNGFSVLNPSKLFTFSRGAESNRVLVFLGVIKVRNWACFPLVCHLGSEFEKWLSNEASVVPCSDEPPNVATIKRGYDSQVAFTRQQGAGVSAVSIVSRFRGHRLKLNN